jgi:autotransporter-associated beta strand protein
LGLGLSIALGIVAGATPASAASSCRWTGATGSPVWSTAGNWTDCAGSVPRSGDFVIFPDGASTPTNVNNLQGLSLSGVLLVGTGRGGTPWDISGSEITLTANFTAECPVGVNGSVPLFSVPIKIGAEGLSIQNLGPVDTSLTPATLLVRDINLNGFTLTFVNTRPITVIGHISGPAAGGVRVLGPAAASTMEFGNDSTYLGSTDILGGTVIVQTGHPFGPPDGGVARLHARVHLQLSRIIQGANAFDKPLVIDEAGVELAALSGANPTFVTGDIVTNQNVAIDVADQASMTFTGRLGNVDTQIVKTGEGPLILSRATANDVWRRVLIANGTLRLGVAGVVPDSAAVAMGGGAFDMNGFNETIGSLSGSFGALQLGASTLTINQVTNGDYLGSIAGTGNLVKNGPARLSLAGPNTLTGTTTMNAGELRLRNPTASAIAGPLVITGGVVSQADLFEQIADSAPVTVNAPGVLDLSRQETIGSLAGSGTVKLNNNLFLIGGNNASTTYSGTINGPTGVVSKGGTGTLTLTGASTVETMLVNTGALIVDGTLNGTVAVDGGILGGIGTVGGINATSGAVSPGSSAGILHAGAASLSGATFVVELNGAGAGTGYDQLALTGDLTLLRSALNATLRFEPLKGDAFTIIALAPGKTVTGIFLDLPEGTVFPIDDRHFSISYHGGDGNDVALTATDDPPALTYFLAEGATGTFFDEDVLIANPNDTTAPVTLTFFKETGEQVVATRTLPARSHTTVHVDQVPGLEATAVSTQVRSDSRLPLAVERSMFWDQSYYAGHTGSAIERPEQDWFFGEGAQGFFSTFLLVINPNPQPASVTFTFLRENEPPVVKTLPVGASSRLTVDASTFDELRTRAFGVSVHATEPVMVERSMYFASTPSRLWSGGHESAGVTKASPRWFLAEGATGSFFDTFILLSNPNATPAAVTMQYLLDSGDTISVQKTIPANARLTVNIKAEEDRRLRNAAVSTVVTSDVPIIAERSMYWPTAVRPWGEGHNSFGVVEAGTRWALAEGRIGGPRKFNTFILLANPQATPADVTVTFLRDSGAPVTKTFKVPAASRFNINVSDVSELRDESFGVTIEVSNNVPIVVERSMYWNSDGVFWSGGTNATGIRLP